MVDFMFVNMRQEPSTDNAQNAHSNALFDTPLLLRLFSAQHTSSTMASPSFFRYPPVSDADRQWGLYVTTVGSSWCEPRAPYPPAPHPAGYHFNWERGRILSEFQVIYVTRGEGTLETKSAGTRTVRAGQAFLLFPGEWHRYRPAPQEGWDEHWLGFAGACAERLLERGLISACRPVFNAGLASDLMAAFTRTINLVKQESPGFQQSLAAVVLEILGRIHAAERTTEVGADELRKAVMETKLYLAERLDESINLPALAGHFAVSYNTLRRAFKLHTGFSPHQYQLELRISKAKQLLAGTSLTIKEIADQLGFESPYYFSRLFKRRIGLSPEVWRYQAHGGNHIPDIPAARPRVTPPV
jgi:AraC-like DNA-binding protein